MKYGLYEYGYIENSGFERKENVSSIMLNGKKVKVVDGKAILDNVQRNNIVLTKYSDFLYDISYNGLDYADGYELYSRDDVLTKMSCSAVKKGNWYGRNFDWYYSDSLSFHVNVKPDGKDVKYGSTGMATLNSLTREVVESKEYSRLYDYLPFHTLDGINTEGVVVNTNVVPSQKGKTTGTTPTGTKEKTITSMMLPRFILDNFSSAQEAVEYIQEHVSVYIYEPMYENFNDDIHVMVADASKAYIIEFVNNATVVTDVTDKAIITNFHLTDVTFNSDGSVYTPYDKSIDSAHDAVTVNGVETFGAGLERYNIANGKYSSLEGYEDIKALMTDDLKYTNCYTNTGDSEIWYSEACGDYTYAGHKEVYVNSPLEDFGPVRSAMTEMYENRNRETPNTWQTVHTAIYDIQQREMHLFSQEDNEKEYLFKL